MHTKNLKAIGATVHSDDGECIGAAYGWDREFEYDAEGKLANKPQSSDEALANAKLWAAAADLLDALQWCASHGYAGGKTFGDVEIVRTALTKAGIA
jgi:hypothetical protein